MAYDAIIVPGGGLDEHHKPAEWVIARLDAALECSGDHFLILLSAGTTYKPVPLDEHGFVIHESAAAAEYAISRGFRAERILLDSWSLDTIGNALFARLMHCDPRGLGELLVVTSDFHMARTRELFDWIFRLTPLSQTFGIEYQGVADVGLDAAALNARLAKERHSLELFQLTAAKITTLAEAHAFVFSRHAAYRAGRANRHDADDSVPWVASY